MSGAGAPASDADAGGNTGATESWTDDDVDLVRTAIDHIEADAVVTVDGERYECDVIIWATGFHHTKVLWPVDIVGRDGVVLRDVWGERPAAYLGMTMPELADWLCAELLRAGAIALEGDDIVPTMAA